MARAPASADLDNVPEPDRLEGFPAPRETERLYGQAAAESAFLEAFRSGRLHHAWILSGRPGIGKATFAYRIARFLLAANAERDMFGTSLDINAGTQAARLVGCLSHPDLLVLRRPYEFKTKKLKTEITIDEVRRLRSFLGMAAGGEGWRVVIVDPADELNINAANGLLKSLEEPPPRTIFLLVSSAPERLLPTVRSRCRTLACVQLDDENLRRAVAQAINASGEDVTAALPSGEEWQILAALSEGSVRRFLDLHAAKGLDLHRRIAGLLASLPALDWLQVHQLGDELASPAAEARYELFFDLLLGLLARMVRAAAAGGGGEAERQLAARLGLQDTLAAWAQLWETTVAEKADVDALNLDRKALILQTFQRLVQASRGAAQA